MALMELCQRCGTKIPYRTKYCDRCKTKEDADRILDDVHHIIPMAKDFSKRLDNDNLIGLFKCHHQQIHYHNIDNKDKLNKYINQLINSDKFVKKLLNINIQ